jgi:hypothetical protein
VGLDWHQLPGPSSFMHQITEDLRDGISVVIKVNDTSPKNILGAIKEIVAHECLSWSHLEKITSDPLNDLFAIFEPSRSAGEIISLSRLLTLPRFQSSIIAIHLKTNENWRRWMPFIEEFAYFSRSQNPLLRSQLLVVIDQTVAENTPRSDLLLSVYDSQLVSLTDTKIYTICRIAKKGNLGIRDQLAAAIAAELSQWDLTLSEILCEAPLALLLNPRKVLFDYAKELHWDKLPFPNDKEKLRGKGIYCTWSDKEEEHSAFLALRRADNILGQRIWRAQVSILFPLIEMRRLEIVSKYEYLFDLPHYLPEGGVITDYADLDWGNICYQMDAKRSLVDDEIYNEAKALKIARNMLAHMEFLPLQILEKTFIGIS